MRPWRAVVFALAALAWPLACHGTKHPPGLVDTKPRDAGSAGEPPLMLGDAAEVPNGACGTQVIPAVTNPPNLSFVVDHSASMVEMLDNGLTKYSNARLALSQVLKAVGHRLNYGVTIFPGLDGVTGCEAGDELGSIQRGDPASYARQGTTGPRLRDLLDRLNIAGLDGGTPAAPTLDKMLGVLQKLDGKSYVVLITDGAPNCNAELSCQASACIPNIEGFSGCGQGVNCCQPSNAEPFANLSCVDADASLQAVQALHDAGIDTFVVGMPGSEPFAELLDAMADVGGTARDAKPKYFSVGDPEALVQALTAIAASVAISCDIPLDYEPPDPDYVNVYFDGKLVEYDPEAGWEWTDEGHVAIRGKACDTLSRGDVLEVQILAGCKTIVR